MQQREQVTQQSASTASSTTAPVSVTEQILLQNSTPIHVATNAAAIAKIPKDYQFVHAGYFTVAVQTLNVPPLSAVAADHQTYIGTEVDTARLIADSLGLKLKVIPSSWEDWPLGVSSGKYDAALINITVTKERKQKFDFATYRKDMIGFFSASTSSITKIETSDDVAGLNVIVGAGTNQEKILLAWIEENKQKGLKPATPIYLQDIAAATLALQSGRADSFLLPNSTGSWIVKGHPQDFKRVGYIEGGWPKTADIAVTLKKDTGLVYAVQEALNGVIASGAFNQVLTRWGVAEEAVKQSEINPLGFGD
ncbi:ABC transporter substrate-binding protein [Acinetobacter larvae]|uniref:ABC transporter substrate-binding protein n=1 Tax=Acinetobacter larvae TaxID=1789224 RepID=A0A1B2M3U4_9GAMM|nr:ABC transporter substrate-binding protein [Acinetobacter larvae]